MDYKSPSLIVINGAVYRKDSFDNQLKLITDTRMILPGEVEDNSKMVDNTRHLKKKWQKLSKFLISVSNFQTIHSEKFKARSMSDPELENRIRDGEDDLSIFTDYHNKINTL